MLICGLYLQRTSGKGDKVFNGPRSRSLVLTVDWNFGMVLQDSADSVLKPDFQESSR